MFVALIRWISRIWGEIFVVAIGGYRGGARPGARPGPGWEITEEYTARICSSLTIPQVRNSKR